MQNKGRRIFCILKNIVKETVRRGELLMLAIGKYPIARLYVLHVMLAVVDTRTTGTQTAPTTSVVNNRSTWSVNA